ncbi:hypothetical protein HDU76_008495, partial [Blyttiomyces sp. JEL0837]
MSSTSTDDVATTANGSAIDISTSTTSAIVISTNTGSNDNSPTPLFRFPNCVLPFIFENACFDRASMCEFRRVNRAWYRGTNRALLQRVVFTYENLGRFIHWAKFKEPPQVAGPSKIVVRNNTKPSPKHQTDADIDSEKNFRIIQHIIVKANQEEKFPSRLRNALSFLPNIKSIYSKRTRDGFEKVWKEIDKQLISRKEELTHLDLFPNNKPSKPNKKEVDAEAKQGNLNFAVAMLGSEPLRKLTCVKMNLKAVDTFSFNFNLVKPALTAVHTIDLSMVGLPHIHLPNILYLVVNSLPMTTERLRLTVDARHVIELHRNKQIDSNIRPLDISQVKLHFLELTVLNRGVLVDFETVNVEFREAVLTMFECLFPGVQQVAVRCESTVAMYELPPDGSPHDIFR